MDERINSFSNLELNFFTQDEPIVSLHFDKHFSESAESSLPPLIYSLVPWYLDNVDIRRRIVFQIRGARLMLDMSPNMLLRQQSRV